MVETRSNAQVLAKHPFFSAWPNDIVESLARELQYVEFPPQSLIVRQGDIVDSIYLITSGKAEVSAIDYDGKVVIIATLGQDEAIGLSQTGMFAPHGIRTASVTALDFVSALKLRIDVFEKILTKYPRFAHQIQHSFDELLKMNLIKQTAPFVQLSAEMIRDIANKIVKIDLKPNQILFREGDNGDYCYIIRSGDISIERNISKHEVEHIATLTSPQIFGETSLLMATKRNATARAATACQLYALPRRVFYDIITKEHKSIESVTVLILERVKSTCNPNVITSESTSATFETILTLKNPENNQYLQLRSYGVRLWELIYSQHSMHEILEIFKEEYGDILTEDVLDLILLLARYNFIQIK